MTNNALLAEFVVNNADLIVESLTSDAIKRYDVVIDKMSGLSNALETSGLLTLADVVKQAAALTKDEMVKLSDANRDRGVAGYIRKMFNADKPTTLERVERLIESIYSALVTSLKYAIAVTTRDERGAANFAELEIDENNKRRLHKLLITTFNNIDDKLVAKKSREIGDEIYRQCSFQELKSLITHIIAVNEIIKDEHTEIKKNIEPIAKSVPVQQVATPVATTPATSAPTTEKQTTVSDYTPEKKLTKAEREAKELASKDAIVKSLASLKKDSLIDIMQTLSKMIQK